MIKKIVSLVLFLNIFISIPLVFACKMSAPADLYIEKVLRLDHAFIDSQLELNKPFRVNFLTTPELHFNTTTDMQEIKVELDGVSVISSLDDFEYDYALKTPYFFSNQLRTSIYDPDYDWATGDSIKRYNNSIMKIYFDNKLVAEFQLGFREAQITKCGYGYGIGTYSIFLIIGLIFIAIICLIIFKLRKK